MRPVAIAALVSLLPLGATATPQTETPAFMDAGDLIPGSGQGRRDASIYYPDMRFPITGAHAYANSQVYGAGGRHGGGGGGGQCSPKNYSYPWRDNFCESRQWGVPMCPGGRGHQGQDIRPETCTANSHWAVAASDGIIAQIGKYSVTLQAPGGTAFRYLHLDRDSLAVHLLDHVKAGQKIGRVSNNFGGAKTTIHLHFDIKDTTVVNQRKSVSYMPPYASLVASYKKTGGH